ncbi:juvenile hormone acid O-methyltransferase-like [Leguminivora glycinivorella]|uniref:juvenile hormone acid O-methyltransferase-like n=1 Tax=Leguminivora glycinivorella TaxID=1035111 RepID=UPI00200FD310|nr:juvenile hormone acid O-methyltransferase-like [Leguminivora glycinivorella]
MRDLNVYQKLHQMPVRDVKFALQEIPFKWKENARIMDIGCGDGSVTMKVWRNYIPKNFMKILGSDKSQYCVDFSTEHFASKRMQFIKLDIEEKIPEELVEGFDHVISSYVFHWVNKQETAFTNVYNLLAVGGSCLLIFLGYFKPYENYRKLSRTPKWSADLENVHTKFMSPYHDSQEPENEIFRMMQRIGFKDIDVTSHHKTFNYVHGVDDFKLLMKCLNPFDSLKDKWEDFMDDYVKLDPEAGTSVYQLLVVYGAK